MILKIKKQIQKLGIFTGGIFSPLLIFAGVPPVTNGDLLPGPDSATDGVSYVINDLLPAITNWVVGAIMALGVVIIIIGGMMYVFSAGDTEMQKKARDTIIWGILGTLLAILSYAIVKIIIFINFLA